MKQIFRYPGGKSKAIKFLSPYWNHVEHDEYREPFVGGGSVFISKPKVKYNWINDIDKDVSAFYRVIQDPEMCEKLIKDLLDMEVTKEMHDKFFDSEPTTDYERAKKQHFLNRTSFAGCTKWRSYTGDESKNRWNIQNRWYDIQVVGKKLEGYMISSRDFEPVIRAPLSGKKMFIYLDPPYSEFKHTAPYPHTFTKEDHIRLAKTLKETNDRYSFLLSYDDTDFIRDLYDWAEVRAETWTYSVVNAGKTDKESRESGKELLISNFTVPTQAKLI